MVKSVIKEILIIILLIVAILLILGIMFYEYTPNSKQVPTAVAEYTLSETIKAQETQNIIETYRVDDDDLALDRRKKIYEEGKINPFSKSAEDPSSSNNSSSNTNSSGNSQGTGNEGKLLNTVK